MSISGQGYVALTDGTNAIGVEGFPLFTQIDRSFLWAAAPYSGEVNATLVAVATQESTLYAWSIVNLTSSVAYLQLFDKALGFVTLGTTVPDMVIAVPANGSISLSPEIGVAFGHAITIAATTTAGGSTGSDVFATLIYWHN